MDERKMRKKAKEIRKLLGEERSHSTFSDRSESIFFETTLSLQPTTNGGGWAPALSIRALINQLARISKLISLLE